MLPQKFQRGLCADVLRGVFFTGRMAWWLPLRTMLVTDIALNFYYWLGFTTSGSPPIFGYQLFNYVAFVAIIFLGNASKPTASFLGLLGMAFWGVAVLPYH